MNLAAVTVEIDMLQFDRHAQDTDILFSFMIKLLLYSTVIIRHTNDQT